MKSNQLVSIIMTCHNGERFLNESITSIINQTYSNWELIFYDNSSVDKSEFIVKSFQDKRIKYFKTAQLVNLGTIRKLSYTECQGTLITFLDVDDYWSEIKLQRQIEMFDAHEKIDVVYTNYFKIENQKIKQDKKVLVKGYCQNQIIYSYINGSPLTAWLTLMIKKSSIEKLEYSFDDKTHISSDFDLIIRLSEFCYFDYLEESLSYYRLHDANESKNNQKEIDELIYIIYKFQKNETLRKIFLHKNFLYKIYIKYFFYKKIISTNYKNLKIIDDIKIKFLFFIIKIIPKKILQFFIKL